MEKNPHYIEEFRNALISCNRLASEKIVNEAAKSHSTLEIVEELITPVMEEIGCDWEEGELSLAQIYMSSRICEKLIDVILPPENPDRKDIPKMAIVILEDYHVLGKRIVYSILRAGGYNLYDYGTMAAEDLIQRVIKDDLHTILISCLMLSSALKVKIVSEKLKSIKPEVKIFVGGAPFRFDEELWKDVGADGTGKSASDAIRLIKNISGGAL
jgi:methanogenic corrinoid protein MtbC1